MRKAQGALEYLIIIAAVLAIAAIVVLFITGAFRGATGGGDIAKCRLAASTCAGNVASAVYGGYGAACATSCVAACADSSGKDLKSGAVMTTTTCINTGTTLPAATTACGNCTQGILTSG